MSDSAGDSHIFTVDVEEYFHVHAFGGVVERHHWEELPSRVERAVHSLLDMLDAADARATFFVLGWVADRKPGLVRAIARRGHEVASHGWSHQRVDELGPEGLREEARRSKERLEEITGSPVIGFRAPSFSVVPGTEWALDVLAEEGYRYDSSMYPIRRPGYGYPGGGTRPHLVSTGAGALLELPVATLKVAGLTLPAGGGAYFRYFPYALFSRAFGEMGSAGTAGVFYIHSWEIDPGQPRLPVSWLTRLRHYRNLDETVEKLETLTSEFTFTSVRDRFGLDPAGDTADDLSNSAAVNGAPRSY